MRKTCSIQVTNGSCANEGAQARWPQTLTGGHMKIIANAKRLGFLNRIGEANCPFAKPAVSRQRFHPGTCLENNDRRKAALLRRHQAYPWATERQLNPKRRRDQNVNFPRFNFLQIARGDFGAFGQFILRQLLAHPLTAHVCTEDLDSLPLFLGNGHDILHRFLMLKMNDTYIVKRFGFFLPASATRGAIGMSHVKYKDYSSAIEAMV